MTFAYGAITLVVQSVLLNELSVLFRRNDVVIGIVLFAWLAGSGLGSAAFRRLPPAWRADGRGTAGLLLPALPVLLFAVVFASRFIAGRMLLRGEPDLLVSATAVLALAAPVGIVSGLLFAALAMGSTLAGAYFLETLGAFAGGAAYSLVLAGQADALVVAYGLALAGLPFAITRGRDAPRIQAAALAATALGLLALPAIYGPTVRASRAAQFSAFNVERVENTRYGTIAKVLDNGRKLVYYDGELLFSPDRADYTEAAVLPALVGKSPRSVLVLGFPPPPFLDELSRLKPARVVAIFRDRELARLIVPPLPVGRVPRGSGAGQAAVRYPELAFADPGRWREKVAGRFDLVVIDRDLPRSISANRFFSREFLSGLKDALAPGGAVFIRVPYEEGRMDPNAIRSLAIVRSTLRAVFPAVGLVAAGKMCFFASDTKPDLDPGTVRARLRSTGLSGGGINAGFVGHYFAVDRRARYESLLDSAGKAPVNGLYDMGLYLANLRYRLWSDLGDQWPIAALLAVVAAFALVRPLARAMADGHAVFLAAAGFAVMTGEIQVLAWFESVSGYVYRSYAFLAAMFMLGIAAGGGYALIARARLPLARRMFDLAIPAWLTAVFWLFSRDPAAFGGSRAVLVAGCAVNYLGGFCLGGVFNHAARKLGAAGEAPEESVRIYSADLMGAAAGALLAPVVLVPVLGHRAVTAVVAAAFLVVAGLTREERHAA